MGEQSLRTKEKSGYYGKPIGSRRSRPKPTFKQLLKRVAFVPFQIVLSATVLIIAPILAVFAVVHDWIMMKFINRTYIYNMSWEDPAIDQRVFNLSDKDHVITIASAGDNVLDYMIEGAKVTAVDFNICQIALTEIKAVAIQFIPYDDFFAIFAESNIPLLKKHYKNTLRHHLSEKTQEFWDRYVNEIKNFLYSGTSGNLAWILVNLLFPLMGLSWLNNAVRSGCSKSDMDKLCADHDFQLQCMTWFLDNVLNRFCCLFAGVPKRQLELGLHRPDNFGRMLDMVLHTDLAHENHFYGGYVMGKYTKDCCPRYLKEEHYGKLRANIQRGGLTLFHGSLEEAVRNFDDRTYTVASLLDHMDWMPPQMIASELAALLEKMDWETGRIFWRSYSDYVHSAPLTWLQPDKVDDTGDLVCMYFSTWIAHLKDTPYTVVERTDRFANANQTFLQRLATGVKVVTFPFLERIASRNIEAKSEHAKAMESFYKHQKNDYDAFRERLLHGRPWLMHSFPVLKDGAMVWVDVGGGTARNLEFFPPEVVKKYFKAIYIVDISPSLLEVARERVRSMGLEDSGIVRLVEGDFTADGCLTSLGLAPNSVDIVTMSYSWSMIPDKEAALRNCCRLLKKDGHGQLGVADFFKHGRAWEDAEGLEYYGRLVESAVHTAWFAQDKVHILTSKDLEIIKTELDIVWDERRRGSVPFLPFLKPYHGQLFAKTRAVGESALDRSHGKKGRYF